MTSRGTIFTLVLAFASIATAQGVVTPAALNAEIQKTNAESTVARLYEEEALWSAVLKNIGSGEESWLKVALALYSGADAGPREQLVLAAGEALEHNPQAVLEIAVPTMGIGVCGGPDVDDQRYDSYSLSITAIERRQVQLAKVSTPKLDAVRERCAKALEYAKKDVRRFYGVQK